MYFINLVSILLVANSRLVYERAVEFFGEENMEEKLYIAFAKFEESQREVKHIFSFVSFVNLRVIYSKPTTSRHNTSCHLSCNVDN